MTTLLLSSLNDPEARLLSLARRLAATNDSLARAWWRVRQNYVEALVVASPATDPRTNRALAEVGFTVVTGADGADRGLWAMVSQGLERPVQRIHFLDLDRLLHWLDRFPDELADLPLVWDRTDLTMLVRTPRAFASHPPCQTLTEGMVNQLLSWRLGISGVDAFSGSYVWSRRAAVALVESPVARDLRFYAEGVLAPFRAGCTIGRHAVDGLEWETPDQYAAEIERDGFDHWLATFESPLQWRRRVEMANLWVEAALTVE